ncbi:hypothetical protein K474DRAFT_1679519 [Panus rudis PR-1116 ss-1]|nr:hypothetical protein K474DRAFT_1679519 [Panus rudis PR-1116 ss-1]
MPPWSLRSEAGADEASLLTIEDEKQQPNRNERGGSATHEMLRILKEKYLHSSKLTEGTFVPDRSLRDVDDNLSFSRMEWRKRIEGVFVLVVQGVHGPEDTEYEVHLVCNANTGPKNLTELRCQTVAQCAPSHRVKVLFGRASKTNHRHPLLNLLLSMEQAQVVGNNERTVKDNHQLTRFYITFWEGLVFRLTGRTFRTAFDMVSDCRIALGLGTLRLSERDNGFGGRSRSRDWPSKLSGPQRVRLSSATSTNQPTPPNSPLPFDFLPSLFKSASGQITPRQTMDAQSTLSHDSFELPLDTRKRNCRTRSLPLSSASTNGDKLVVYSSRKRHFSEASRGDNKENQPSGADWATLPHLRLISRAFRSAASRARAKQSSPLLVLPNELLLMIFGFLVDDDTSATLIRATHICHRLRVVALSSPLLWTKVRTTHLDCVLAFARRTRRQAFEAILDFTQPYDSAPIELDTRGLQRPELKSLRSLEIVASLEVMQACLLHFPDQLPSLEDLKLEVDPVSLYESNYPPPVEFQLRPATGTSYWAIRTLELRNIQIRYPARYRRALPHLRVFKSGLDPEYTEYSHAFPIDEFMNLVDDCPAIQEIVISNPGYIPPSTRTYTAFAPSLVKISFVYGYACAILRYLSIPESSSVFVTQLDYDMFIPQPLAFHPAFNELDTIELTYISSEGFNQLDIRVSIQDGGNGACVPLNISWDRSLTDLTVRNLGMIMHLFPSVHRMVVRQAGKISEAEWIIMLSALRGLHSLQITYYPDSADIDLFDAVVITPFLVALATLVRGGLNHPQNLDYITFRGFETNLLTIDHINLLLRTLRAYDFSFQRMTIVQRYEGESEYATADDWTRLGDNYGQIIYEIDSELPRSIEA